MKKIGERVSKIREAKGLEKQDFSNYLSVSKTVVYEVENGSREIPKSMITQIAKKIPNVNINWLLTGEGEMFLDERIGEILDGQILTDAIETLEEALFITDRSMQADKKAELIVEIYKMLAEKQTGREPVLRLIKEAI